MLTSFKSKKIDRERSPVNKHLITSNAIPSEVFLRGFVLSGFDESDFSPSGILRVAIASEKLPILASVASSCLLSPRAGDLVVVCKSISSDSQDENSPLAWIISVLKREDPNSCAVLSVPDVEEVWLQANHLKLVADSRLELGAQTLEVQASRAIYRGNSVQILASTVSVVARKLSRVAQAMHSFAQSISEHSRTKVVVVDDVHSLKAGTQVIESNEAMMLKGEQVIIDAKKTVKIDGDHILMG